MEATQESRLYVSNLPYSMKEDQLKAFMVEAGCAEPRHIQVLTTYRGQSRGCAIVAFANASDAQAAISNINERSVDGRTVYAREDREVALPAASGAGGRQNATKFVPRGSPGAGAAPGTTVFFGNLPFSMAWQDLKDFARSAGPVVRADVPVGPQRRPRGFGTVVYETPEAAEKAIAEFNGQEIQSRVLEVRLDRPASERNAHPAASAAATSNAPGGFDFTAASGHGPVSEFLHVSNLPWQTTDSDLVELFETIDRVVRAETQRLSDGRMSGSGVVQFADPVAAELAVRTFNGYLYGGLNLVVTYARYPPPAF